MNMRIKPTLLLAAISVSLMACVHLSIQKPDLNARLRRVQSMVTSGSDEASEPPADDGDDGDADDGDDTSVPASGADPGRCLNINPSGKPYTSKCEGAKVQVQVEK